MARTTILSNDFLRSLVAVGQVDLLVGLPTFNNADTVKPIAEAAQLALARYFPRLRTALVNSDGGSVDGTPEIVRNVTAAADGPVRALRTIHRVETSHAGSLGKGSALRAIFAAADLTQARAVTVIDPDITSMSPDWIERLARPVLDQRLDYVGPVYSRSPFEGPLVRQVVRPVFQAAYGVPMREPVGGEFACSGRFAAHCLRQSVWDYDFTRFGVDIWLAGEAVAGGFQVGQTQLGRRTPMRASNRLPLADLVKFVVGALFTCLELHEAYWKRAVEPRDLPTFGEPEVVPHVDAPHAVEPGDLERDVADLLPILETLLTPATLAGLVQVAQSDDETIGDDLWAHLLGEFMIGHMHQVIGRDHLLQAFVPLYRSRVVSFIEAHRRDDPQVVAAAYEHLNASCLGLRPGWIEACER